MKAKEMFEEIGYKLNEKTKTLISYEKELDCCSKFIDFNIHIKQLMIYNDHDNFISMKELKAINKQVKELGWLEKEK